VSSTDASVRVPDGRTVALVGVSSLACAAIAVAATLSPLLTIGAAIAVALVVLTFVNLTYGVALFVLITFFETLPGLDGVALSRPFGFLLVLSWLGALARGGRELPLLPRDRPVLAYLLVAFVAWGAVSTSWATEPALAQSGALRLGLVVILVFVVFSALRTRRDLEIVAWAYLSGAFLVSLVALATGSNKAGRLALGELDPNGLAAALAAAVMLALFLLWGTMRSAVRVLLLGFLLTYAIAIVLSESRAGLVALGIAAVVAIVVGGELRWRMLATITIVAGLGIGYYVVVAPAEIRDRAASTISAPREVRLDTWAIAVQMAEDNPVLGVGLGNFEVVEVGYLAGELNLFSARKIHALPLAAHNTYLEVLSELGVVGLALFAAVILAAAVPALGAIRYREVRAVAVTTSQGLVIAFVVLLVAYFFVSGTYAKQIWLFLGVIAAVPTALRSDLPGAPRRAAHRISSGGR